MPRCRQPDPENDVADSTDEVGAEFCFENSRFSQGQTSRDQNGRGLILELFLIGTGQRRKLISPPPDFGTPPVSGAKQPGWWNF